MIESKLKFDSCNLVRYLDIPSFQKFYAKMPKLATGMLARRSMFDLLTGHLSGQLVE
jgi:hypothetical protein